MKKSSTANTYTLDNWYTFSIVKSLIGNSVPLGNNIRLSCINGYALILSERPDPLTLCNKCVFNRYGSSCTNKSWELIDISKVGTNSCVSRSTGYLITEKFKLSLFVITYIINRKFNNYEGKF